MGFDEVILRDLKLKTLFLALKSWAEAIKIVSAEQRDTGMAVFLFHSAPAPTPAARKNEKVRMQ